MRCLEELLQPSKNCAGGRSFSIEGVDKYRNELLDAYLLIEETSWRRAQPRHYARNRGEILRASIWSWNLGMRSCATALLVVECRMEGGCTDVQLVYF